MPPPVTAAPLVRAEPLGDIPIMRPLLPSAEKLLPYLKRIDESRWYSNGGPLEDEFREKLAPLFGLSAEQTLPMSSGTLALQIALSAGARPGKSKCLMPSWTFVATPLAAMQAGLEPHFMDIDPATWSLPLNRIRQRRDLGDLAAIVLVAPFGRLDDLAEWSEFSAETGVPIIVDAAAAFDGLSRFDLSRHPNLSVAISLHATKPFGIGEGGLLLSGDAAYVTRCAQMRNFGFWGTRASRETGTNAKLSEYGAAVGLAAFDEWPAKRQAYARACRTYHDALNDRPEVDLISDPDHWISSTFNIGYRGDMDRLSLELNRRHIETRQWWGQGCHKQPAFARLPRDPLPETEKLAPRVLGLPLSPDITETDIARICESFTSL